MNAAARAINEVNLFTGQWFQLRLAKSSYSFLMLLMVFLFSACSVIYISNEFRSDVNLLAQAEQVKNGLMREHAQLLLEQASLATSARVEKVAIQRLRMHLPQEKQIVILKGQ